MILEKIKLAGFKSFVDPTVVLIPSNLVGVVGPNGCGKSNVIDAVRWVMGESSAKHLRGESMTDVIFNGSRSRKPVGVANIELVFDNASGRAGGQYAKYNQISVKRQVTRDAQSNYFLNGVRCRRRDITDLFLGTGLGPRSYAIIEQGTISRIIEAKPEELRVFIEEAAGISKYKERRKETETRIRHTRENLERLLDVREEVQKQKNKLERQAKTAEKYKTLKQQQRQLSQELSALRWQDLSIEKNVIKKKMTDVELQLEQKVSIQRQVEAGMVEKREAYVEANDQFNEIQALFYSVGSEISSIEQEIKHIKDKQHQQQLELQRLDNHLGETQAEINRDQTHLLELNATLEIESPELEVEIEIEESINAYLIDAEQLMHEWQAEWDNFNEQAVKPSQVAQVERAHITQLEKNMAQFKSKYQRLYDEMQRLSIDDLEIEIESLAEALLEHESTGLEVQQALELILQKIQTIRQDSTAKQSQWDIAKDKIRVLKGKRASLEALQQAAFNNESKTLNQWLEQHQLKNNQRLAQCLTVTSGWENAVEMVLNDMLEMFCIEQLDSVEPSLRDLAEGSLGFIEMSAAGVETNLTDFEPLLDKITTSLPLGNLISGIFIAEDRQAALSQRHQLKIHESLITKEGFWVGQSWLKQIFSKNEKTGSIQRAQELRQLMSELETFSEKEMILSVNCETLKNDLNEHERLREQAQLQYNEVQRTVSDFKNKLNAKRLRLEQVNTRKNQLTIEIEELQSQVEEDEQDMMDSRSKLHRALAEMEQLAEQKERLIARRDNIRHQLDHQRQKHRQQRDKVQTMIVRIESMRSEKNLTEKNLQKIHHQFQQSNERKQQILDAVNVSDEPVDALKQKLNDALEKRISTENLLNNARNQTGNIDHKIRELDKSRIECEAQLEEIRANLETVKMAHREKQFAINNLIEQIENGEAGILQTIENLPEDANAESWDVQIKQIDGQVDKLGSINLAAIDEFAEQSERLTYLDSQYQDLTDSLTTLEDAIRKIDRETRTRFKETFDKINTGFQEKFPKLFGGGHADLQLTGTDLLDTGISVMARPPGKRNSTIHLLSGGEKALTAISLVFSIFELNPAPFCMLDEVDAPLDEANVGRFCQTVKEMSKHVQFIFITHNKTTMELANQLTGVTMSEPGVSRVVAVDVDEAVELAS